jgi:single-strand DNA-binding protein
MATSNINRVVLTGNLTRDPVLRNTSAGTPVWGLRIASNTRRKTSGGEWVDKPNRQCATIGVAPDPPTWVPLHDEAAGLGAAFWS